MGRRIAFSALFLVALSFASHLPLVLDGKEFIQDDTTFAENRVIRKFDPAAALTTDFWGRPLNAPNSIGSWRPVPVISLQLDFPVSGYDPRVMRFTNLVIHAAAALLAMIFFMQLGLEFKMALMGAAFFAVAARPLEARAFIIGRADVFAAFFSLLSLVIYMKWRKSGGIALLLSSLLAFILGVFSKENAAILPGVIFLVVFLDKYNSHIKRDVIIMLAMAAIVGVWMYLRMRLIGSVRQEITMAQLAGLTFWERLPTAGHLYFRHILKLFAPGLVPHEEGQFEVFLTDHAKFLNYLYPAAAAACVLAFVWIKRIGGIIGLTATGILFTSAALVPVIHLFMPVNTVTAERFSYFPAVGIGLTLAALFSLFLKLSEMRKRVLYLAFGAIILFNAAITFAGSYAFQSAPQFYFHLTAVSPKSQLAWLGMGNVLLDLGKNEDAYEAFGHCYDEAHNIHETRCLNGMGVSLARQGKYKEAEDLLTGAFKMSKSFEAKLDLLYNIGVVFYTEKNKEKAVAYFSKVLETKPDVCNARFSLAKARMIYVSDADAADSLEQGIKEFEASIACDPDNGAWKERNKIEINAEIHALLEAVKTPDDKFYAAAEKNAERLLNEGQTAEIKTHIALLKKDCVKAASLRAKLPANTTPALKQQYEDVCGSNQ